MSGHLRLGALEPEGLLRERLIYLGAALRQRSSGRRSLFALADLQANDDIKRKSVVNLRRSVNGLPGNKDT